MDKIIVTNDDGINSESLWELAGVLGTKAEVYVFAPAGEQSGKSQSITFMRPINITEVDVPGAAAAYAVDGTPTDCVKMGITVLEEKGIVPDYVISGINYGYNSGLAAYYSGTVAAAREGALNGIKSIALSVGGYGELELEYTLSLLPTLMEMVGRLQDKVFLSYNAPDLPADEIKGYRIVEAAPYGYGVNFVFRKEDEGLYQMGGAPGIQEDGMKYDMDANEAGYASISPIPTSLNDEESLKALHDEWA